VQTSMLVSKNAGHVITAQSAHHMCARLRHLLACERTYLYAGLLRLLIGCVPAAWLLSWLFAAADLLW
jgi:hypothetical protein